MEKNNQLSAHRARSFQAVVGDGFRLYLQNFWKLLRSSWIQVLVYALILGFSMTYFFTDLLPRLITHHGMLSQLLTWGATLVAFLISAVLFAFAGGIAPLHEHWHAETISMPLRWWGRWPWKLTFRGLTALPMMLWKALRKGQAGALIALALIMLLLVLVATVIFQLPAIILAIANVEAQNGLAAGDAVDMPENIWWLNFATFSFCGVLQGYIHLTTLFPLYYIWGNAMQLKGKQ